MECRVIQELLSAYLDDVLTSTERKDVERHLSQCEECSQELADLQKTIEVVKTLGEVSPPENFRVELEKRLTDESGLKGEAGEAKGSPKGLSGLPPKAWQGYLARARKAVHSKWVAFAAVLVVGIGVGVMSDKVFDSTIHNLGAWKDEAPKSAAQDSAHNYGGYGGATKADQGTASNYKYKYPDGIEQKEAREKEVGEPQVSDAGTVENYVEEEVVRGLKSPAKNDVNYSVDGEALNNQSNNGVLTEEGEQEFRANTVLPDEKDTANAKIAMEDTEAVNNREVTKKLSPEEERPEIDKERPKQVAGIEEAKAGTEKLEGQDLLYQQAQIIKNGWLSIEVKNFNSAARQISQSANQFGGYVESSDEYAGDRKSGNFVVRVPVKRFPDALTELEKLGKVVNKRLSGEDVSLEYRDANARLKNLRTQESRLLTLVNKAESLGDILALENELNRVRQEIETIEGRINYLASVTEMATIRLELHEVSDKNTPGAEGVFKRAWNAFVDSCKSLLGFVESTIVFFGSSLPYLILLIGGAALYRYYKKKN